MTTARSGSFGGMTWLREWELKNGSDEIKKRRQKKTESSAPCMQQQHLNIPPPPTGEIDETICRFVIFKMKKLDGGETSHTKADWKKAHA